MKTLKALTLGLVVAAAFVGTASAQTIVKIAGSTAFRSPVSAAIIDYLATAGGAHSVYAGDVGGLLGGSSQIFANGTIGSGGSASTIVETYWTGSLAGTVDVVATNSDVNTKYIDPATMGGSSVTAFNGGAPVNVTAHTGGVTLTPTYVNGSPDMAMSDSVDTTISTEILTGVPAASFVNPALSVGTYSSIVTLGKDCGTKPLESGTAAGPGSNGGPVGVVGFQWVVGNITTGFTGLVIPTNIDQQTARSLIYTGYVASSQLTGGSGTEDTNNYYYMVGRNEDSGTRIDYLQESQNTVSAPINQYAFNSSATAPGSATALTSLELFPPTSLSTEGNIIWNASGHSGYATGGNVATVLEGAEGHSTITFTDGSNALGNSGASYLISCLGLTDAASATGAGGHALSYGGVPFSVQAIQNGQYPCWCYEHAYHISGLATAKATVVNGIADEIYNTDADIKSDGTHQAATGGVSPGVLIGSMNVSRTATEGGIIIHN